FRHHELRCAIDRWMREDPPDLVFLYSSSMGQYVEAYPRPLRVMHFAELDSDKWAQYAAKSGLAGRFIYGREARELLKYEQRIARAFDTSLVVSDVERELFRKLIPDVDPVVIPNGVEVGHFTSAGDGMREPHTVVFTGVMDYEPNVDGVLWFAESCWPQLRAEFPDARFLVVGNRPTAAIQALDGRHGITVTGWVETTPPYFDRATVAIAPLRLARGLQNKVLEAMSMGLPVVATQKASQGLGQVPADTLSVADDPAAITSAAPPPPPPPPPTSASTSSGPTCSSGSMTRSVARQHGDDHVHAWTPRPGGGGPRRHLGTRVRGRGRRADGPPVRARLDGWGVRRPRLQDPRR
ncbi:MAG: glycosyltransferase, partial [Planctomycetota bacterium]